MDRGSEVLTLTIAAAVNNWFRRRRAMAMAVAMLPSAAALGTVISLTAAAFLAGGDVSRELGLGIGAFVLALAWPLSLLVRNRPEDYAQHPDGVETENIVASWPDYTAREALRSRAFWFMTIGRAFAGLGLGAFALVLVILLRDAGFPPLATGGASALLALVGMPFSLAAGMLGDRIPVRWVLFAFTLLALAGLGVLLFGRTLTLIYLSSALVGAGTNGAVSLVFAAHEVYFGRSNFAAIAGMGWPVSILVNIMAPLATVAAYDSAAGSCGALAIVAAMFGVGGLLFAMIGPPRLSPSQRRPVVSEELSGWM